MFLISLLQFYLVFVMKLADIKKSVVHGVKVSLERAIYDAASQIEESELRAFIESILGGVYTSEDMPE